MNDYDVADGCCNTRYITSFSHYHLLSTMIIIAAVLVFSLLLAKLAVMYYQWRTSPLRRAPGPPSKSFLLGYIFTILKEPFLQPHKAWWKQALLNSKEVPFLAYSTLFGRYALTVLDCSIVQHILTQPASRDPVRYPKKYLLLRETIGDGLVTLEGSVWSRHRRIIQPSFHAGFVNESLEAAVPALTAQLIGAWSKATASREIDVASHLSALTLDVIGVTAFSHEFRALHSLDEWVTNSEQLDVPALKDAVITSLLDSLNVTPLVVFLTVLRIPWLEKYMSIKSWRTRQALNDAVDNVIRQARTKKEKHVGSEESYNDANGQRSLLQLLFDATDTESKQPLNDTELRDEVKTFIVAGHETTSTWCYWALYALAKYPDVQLKVYNDIANHAAGRETLELKTTDHMSYFAAFLNEVLRMFPPVGMIVRNT